MSTLRPHGVNHMALSTCDMKAQLEFWCDVLACPLKALYWMHSVEGVFHAFVELGPESYIAFVQHPDNAKEIQLGITHAGNGSMPVTRGALQHFALHVDSMDELLAMRDRVRSRGVPVLGPIDHGFIQSMYFSGPEGLNLEICTGRNIDAEAWIDPEVQGLCHISAEELAAMKAPAAFERPAEPVAQPAPSPGKPKLYFPTPEIYDAVMGLPDQQVWESMSETEPPANPAGH